MVLKFFWPKKEFSFKELEKMTAKPKGKWTWPSAGFMSLQKMGFRVRGIGDFDYEKFAKTGEEYLVKRYGKRIAAIQIRNSDIRNEKKLARQLVGREIIEKKIPTFEDLERFLKEGYLAICIVNSKKLNREPGYTGHAVVVIGFDNRNVYLHDPGLPPSKDRVVSREVFEEAWAYPRMRDRNLIVIKK